MCCALGQVVIVQHVHFGFLQEFLRHAQQFLNILKEEDSEESDEDDDDDDGEGESSSNES